MNKQEAIENVKKYCKQNGYDSELVDDLVYTYNNQFALFGFQVKHEESDGLKDELKYLPTIVFIYTWKGKVVEETEDTAILMMQ